MSEHLAKQTIAELHDLVAITLDLYDRLEDLGDGPTDASDLDHIALGLFDRIEALQAENKLLLEALESWRGRISGPTEMSMQTLLHMTDSAIAIAKGEE